LLLRDGFTGISQKTISAYKRLISPWIMCYKYIRQIVAV
jgi:hypothetical protein